MVKSKTITVQGIDISLYKHNDEDYICISDMVKGTEGEDHIRNWMRNKNTIEFLGLWEQLNNPQFKGVEFDTFLREAGLNRFNMTPRKWIESTNAIGIISKAGRNGGTYAHKDIAFEFATWISPVFKLYIIREYQRLKEIESNQYGLEWNVKRVLSKVNYAVHTDAIQQYVIPYIGFSQKKEWVYASEADMINIIVFGCTAKQWREANMNRVMRGENIRDMASINELAILSNLESQNALLIKQNINRKERAKILSETCREQRKLLEQRDFIKSVKKLSENTYVDAKDESNDNFDKGIDKILGYNMDED